MGASEERVLERYAGSEDNEDTPADDIDSEAAQDTEEDDMVNGSSKMIAVITVTALLVVVLITIVVCCKKQGTYQSPTSCISVRRPVPMPTLLNRTHYSQRLTKVQP